MEYVRTRTAAKFRGIIGLADAGTHLGKMATVVTGNGIFTLSTALPLVLPHFK
jgi:hypothetical protein